MVSQPESAKLAEPMQIVLHRADGLPESRFQAMLEGGIRDELRGPA
jgi:hypothetical protein